MNISTKLTSLAPIAEQEGCELDQPLSSSSFVGQQQIGQARKPHVRNMPRMVRLRRKRKDDPFSTLIQSTKKMRLNDQLNFPADGQTTVGQWAAKSYVTNVAERTPNGGQNGTEKDSVLFAQDDEDELVFYYGGQDEEDDSDADGYDDDSDSNAEEYYKNDYPDEENGKFISFADGVGTNEFENDSTSGDDNFDHYGDESPKYRHFCYEDGEDDDNEFTVGKIISAKNEDSGDDSEF